MAGKYAEFDGEIKRVWYVDRLWKLAETITPIEIQIEEIIGLDSVTWFSDKGDQPTVRSISKHAKRIFEADLSYPPILTEDKKVFDGMHRIAKHLMEGKETISVKIFKENPTPDQIETIKSLPFTNNKSN